MPPEYRQGSEPWLASNVREFTSAASDMVMSDNDGTPVKLPGYRVDALADAGIRYIHQHADEPFFLMLSFIEPHHQNHRDEYAAPEGYRERYQGRWTPPDLEAMGGSSAYHLGGYWGCIRRLDEAFGRVLDAIRSLGLRENTIVLYTAITAATSRPGTAVQTGLSRRLLAHPHGADRPRLPRRRPAPRAGQPG